MRSPLSRLILPPMLLTVLVFHTACAPKPPSRWTNQPSSSGLGSAASSNQATSGSQFNQLFPKSETGSAVVPAQEKAGFAEYKINQGGKTVAMLSISDTTSNAAAVEKYKHSTFKIAGYPAVDQGQTSTGILVNNRYQVKVLSRDPAFTRADRIAWLQKFDLDGLSTLK